MYKLYWNKDTAAVAPELVLEEAGLAYEKVVIDAFAGETWQPEFLAINPAGYIPALVREDGTILYESAAICLYLCDRHGLTDLLPPPDDPDRGLLYRGLFYMTSTVQDAYKRYYYAWRFSTDEADAPRIKARAVEALVERWKVIDDHLASGGPYYLGSRFSLVELYMQVLVTWFPPDEAELLARYPAIRKAFEATAERPAVRKVFGL